MVAKCRSLSTLAVLPVQANKACKIDVFKQALVILCMELLAAFVQFRVILYSIHQILMCKKLPSSCYHFYCTPFLTQHVLQNYCGN